MAKQNLVVSARIDKKTKAAAEEVLASLSPTVSEAISMMMTFIAREKSLPFDP